MRGFHCLQCGYLLMMELDFSSEGFAVDELELELETVQAITTQKPLLKVRVGAHVVHKKSGRCWVLIGCPHSHWDMS